MPAATHRAPTTANRHYPLAAGSGKTTVLIWLLGSVLPLLITAVALAIALATPGPKQLIGNSVPLTVALTLAMVALLTVPLTLLLQFSPRRSGATLDDGVLDIRAGWYRQRVPVGEIDLAQARIVDLTAEKALRPALKTNGIGLPGWQAGHFRRWPGLDKAFCAITDRRRVLYLPERSGRALLLSVQRPQALLDALRGTDEHR